MKDIKPAIMLFLAFTLVCGGIYPAVVTGLAQVFFPRQAAGSFISDKNGKEVGSTLISQPFSDPKYFWPRPSAASDFANNPMGSGGSNTGPTNPDYLKTVSDRVKTLRASGVTGAVPSEMVQASASGLDPHISPESALLQVARIAKARGITTDIVEKLVRQKTEERQFGFLGVRHVNVLALNIALDTLKP